MSAQAIRPSRLWYWLAAAAVVASIVWLVLGLLLWFRSVHREVERLQRVPVPGSAEVRLAEPGGYTVYFEGPGASDGQAAVPPLRVSLTSAGGGQEITIRPYGGLLTYDIAGHSGRALGTFRIERAGTFVLKTGGERLGPEADVAVGRGGGRIARALVMIVPGVLILFFGGVILAVVVAIRRSNARRPARAPVSQAAASPSGASPSGAGATGWFADPSGRHRLRYWDGERWTAHVSDGQGQMVDPLG